MCSIKTMKRRRGPKIVHFIIHCLDNETHVGLRWMDRNLGLFSMPWPRQGTSRWRYDSSKIFKDWALLKNGNKVLKDLFSVWKTRFRTALNKITTIRKFKNLDKDNIVFQITNIDDERLEMDIRNYDYDKKLHSFQVVSDFDQEKFQNLQGEIQNFQSQDEKLNYTTKALPSFENFKPNYANSGVKLENELSIFEKEYQVQFEEYTLNELPSENTISWIDMPMIDEIIGVENLDDFISN